MNISQQIATQLRAVYFGGNWTSVNLKEQLSTVTWEQATAKPDSCNTIAALTYHLYYYIPLLLKVLDGGPLDGKDAHSWETPAFTNQQEWEAILTKSWEDAETFAKKIEQLPDEMLLENFGDGKYGNWYRNLTGIIEHCHYHLGQIVIIKKLLVQKA